MFVAGGPGLDRAFGAFGVIRVVVAGVAVPETSLWPFHSRGAVLEGRGLPSFFCCLFTEDGPRRGFGWSTAVDTQPTAVVA